MPRNREELTSSRDFASGVVSMSRLSQTDAALLASVVESKIAQIGESLNQCFDSQFQLEAGVLQDFEGSAPGTDLLQSGLIVSICLGDEYFLCALPEVLPLPEWYTHPDVSQQARLDTLAMEWSLNCLPDEQPGEDYFCEAVPSLWEAIQSCRPQVGAQWLPLTPNQPDVPAESQIWLLWPAGASLRDLEANSNPYQPESEPGPDRAQRLARLINVPVPVIVKLAEKKIELGQLMAMGPGAIVMFEKSCEDLLDLYVNNQLYCRGEAVKIGEKFGIKINEVGSIEERVSAVMGLGG